MPPLFFGKVMKNNVVQWARRNTGEHYIRINEKKDCLPLVIVQGHFTETHVGYPAEKSSCKHL